MKRLVPSLTALAVLVLACGAAAEVGTCFTLTGVSAAPWSDPVDPACGDDCADEDERCESDAACATAPAPARLPAPSGPLCFSGGPGCEPAAPALQLGSFGLAATEPAGSELPRRGVGTLPGPGAPTLRTLRTQVEITPRAPPPR